jgi:hypothetical protein
VKAVGPLRFQPYGLRGGFNLGGDTDAQKTFQVPEAIFLWMLFLYN